MGIQPQTVKGIIQKSISTFLYTSCGNVISILSLDIIYKQDLFQRY